MSDNSEKRKRGRPRKEPREEAIVQGRCRPETLAKLNEIKRAMGAESNGEVLEWAIDLLHKDRDVQDAINALTRVRKKRRS